MMTTLHNVQITARTDEIKNMFAGPAEVAVPVASPAAYQLTFTPSRVGTFKACLTLCVAATQEKWTYHLEAVGLEPPATDNITCKCVAGSSKHIKLPLTNSSDTPVEYAVLTDLANVQGSASIEVLPHGNTEYEMLLRPMISGIFTGMITFSSPNGHIQWYTIELDVTEPPKIATIHVHMKGAHSAQDTPRIWCNCVATQFQVSRGLAEAEMLLARMQSERRKRFKSRCPIQVLKEWSCRLFMVMLTWWALSL
jgi:hypothetical protein